MTNILISLYKVSSLLVFSNSLKLLITSFLNLEDDKKEVINNLSEFENTNNEETLYNDIKVFVIKNQKASTSLIQRYFSLGYARAARMMDRLEEEGIVSESNGIKPREVLVKEVDEDGNM